MANNIDVKDAAAATQTMKTTDNAGVHTPHTNVDNTVSAQLVASEEFTGQSGAWATIITPTVTCTAGAYSAGDVIGGRLTLTNAMRITSGTGILQNIILTTADGETPELWIPFFDSATASSIADNAAFAWGSGDHAKFLGAVHVETADWQTRGSDGVYDSGPLARIVAANGSRNLYAYIMAVGTPTFGATTDVTFRSAFLGN